MSAPCRKSKKKKRKEKTPLGHIDLCSEEAFFFLYFFKTSSSVLRKKMSVSLWVWWVLIEEFVGMVSLDALLLVCPGSNRWGSWQGGVQRSVGFRELIEGEKAGREFWRKRRQSIEVRFQKSFIIFLLFFNIVLAWKTVGVAKVSVLYVYIDKRVNLHPLPSNSTWSLTYQLCQFSS